MAKSKFPNEGARRLAMFLAEPNAPHRLEIAFNVGMHASSVKPVLRGDRHPTLEQAKMFADLYGIPMRAWTEEAVS